MMQTTKPRARWFNSGLPGFSGWLVTHPATVIQLISRTPHDSAAELLREHVLPRMVEGGRKC